MYLKPKCCLHFTLNIHVYHNRQRSGLYDIDECLFAVRSPHSVSSHSTVLSLGVTLCLCFCVRETVASVLLVAKF